MDSSGMEAAGMGSSGKSGAPLQPCGVLRLPGLGYLATIFSGNEPDAFPIMFSPDLVNWTPSGHVFPRGTWPHWAKSNMWVAEIHKIDEDRK